MISFPKNQHLFPLSSIRQRKKSLKSTTLTIISKFHTGKGIAFFIYLLSIYNQSLLILIKSQFEDIGQLYLTYLETKQIRLRRIQVLCQEQMGK